MGEKRKAGMGVNTWCILSRGGEEQGVLCPCCSFTAMHAAAEQSNKHQPAWGHTTKVVRNELTPIGHCLCQQKPRYFTYIIPFNHHHNLLLTHFNRDWGSNLQIGRSRVPIYSYPKNQTFFPFHHASSLLKQWISWRRNSPLPPQKCSSQCHNGNSY